MKFTSALYAEIVLSIMISKTNEIEDIIKDFVALGFIVEIDKASPNDNWAVVLDVGTIPSPDSSNSGSNNFILADLYKWNKMLANKHPSSIIILLLII